jgi:putative phage-type endonuclease
MKIVDAFEQGSHQWLQWRKTKVTATDSCIILGQSPWCSPLQLWNKKMGLEPEQEVNDAMLEGSRLEPIARAEFERLQEKEYTPIVVVHESYDWCSASLDGYHDGYIKSAVEIKCPGIKDHLSATKGKIPKKYQYQLQHQMFVCDLDMIYYYSFDKRTYKITGKPCGCIVEVQRNQQMIDKMLEAELKFYDCMVTGTPPEMTDKEKIEMYGCVDPIKMWSL